MPILLSVCLLGATTYFGIRYPQVHVGPDAFSVYKLTGFYAVLNGVFGLIYFSFNDESRSRLAYTLDDLGFSSLITAICWLCVTLGYFALRPVRVERAGRRVFSVRFPTPLRLAIALAIGWLARLDLVATGRYFHVSDDVTTVQSSSSTFIINTVSRFPIVVLFVVVAGLGARSLRTSPLALILFATELAWAVPSGARENLITLLLGLIVVRYYVTGLRIPRTWLVVGLVVGAIAFPLIANFRETTGTAGLARAEAVTPDQVLHGNDESGGLLATLPGALLGRFSDSESFAAALARGPEVLDTMPAGRFVQLCLATLVPRPVWPAKPDPNTYGNEFGRVSGMVSEQDLLTSINVPLSLQWWMVGGFIGVIVGGLLTGLLLRFINGLLMIRFGGAMGVAVFASSAVSVATVLATILPANAAGLFKVVVVTSVLGIALTVRRDRPLTVAPYGAPVDARVGA